MLYHSWNRTPVYFELAVSASYPLHVCHEQFFFPSDTLIYGISRDSSKKFILRTCEHMILGQLRMGARQTKNAPLSLLSVQVDQEAQEPVYALKTVMTRPSFTKVVVSAVSLVGSSNYNFFWHYLVINDPRWFPKTTALLENPLSRSGLSKTPIGKMPLSLTNY